MRLITYLLCNIGPMTPFLLCCSVITFGVVLSVIFNKIFHKTGYLQREQVILQWAASISIVFGVLGTLLGLRGVFPNISPGDPSASLTMILSGLGHALSSSVAGLSIAAFAELGTLLARLTTAGRIACKD